MAHPEVVSVEQRAKREHLSPLLRAKAATQGVVCACPFGCGVEDCDDNGYCRHLVGYTTDKKSMEPMVFEDGRYSIKCRREPIPGQRPHNPALGQEEKTRPVLDEVLEMDQLMQVSGSYRVYRDTDGAGQALLVRREKEKKAERQAMLRGLLEDPDAKALLLNELTAG